MPVRNMKFNEAYRFYDNYEGEKCSRTSFIGRVRRGLSLVESVQPFEAGSKTEIVFRDLDENDYATIREFDAMYENDPQIQKNKFIIGITTKEKDTASKIEWLINKGYDARELCELYRVNNSKFIAINRVVPDFRY